MIKRRLFWIITGLTAFVIVVLILFFSSSHDFSVGKTSVEELPEGQTILCNAYPEVMSVQKGDTFLYIIEVLYDTNSISEIDSTSLDDNVNLEPFEIRKITEIEFNLDSGVRVYQRQYELQLISGDVEYLYEFPTIVVRYKLADVDGYAETSIIPESVYVAPRLTSNAINIISDIELGGDPLNPIVGKIEDTSHNYLPWIFWILGIFFAILMVFNLTLPAIQKGKKKAKQANEMDMTEVLYQAYRSLLGNIEAGAKPRSLLHQMDHILRLVLIQKEGALWLEEMNLDTIPSEIKSSVISLFEKCQKSYGIEDADPKEAEEAFRNIEEILGYYFAEEMR